MAALAALRVRLIQVFEVLKRAMLEHVRETA
jgi:hypothetical protein